MGCHCRNLKSKALGRLGWYRWLFLLASWLTGPAIHAATVCGAPSYDKAVDSGLYLWESGCGSATSTFHVLALAGGSTQQVVYEGQIDASQALAGVTGRSLEANDQLGLLSGNTQIHYSLKVKSPWLDEFRVDVPRSASLCFGNNLPVGSQVRVGPDATPITAPFDVRTLQSCAEPPGQYKNVVVIVTDDQRWDTVWSTPSIDALAAQGMTFTNAFVSTPLCGPVRTNLLSGGFRGSNTGIISNAKPISPLTDFNENDTLAVRLQEAGYKTMFVGKYHNQYPSMKRHVPPGWTRWVANNQQVVGPWYDFTVTTGSSGSTSSSGVLSAPIPQYVTEFHRDEVLSFLDGVGPAPFFVYWSTYPPHGPATTLPEDAAIFADFQYRDRAWGETDLSDKPAWVSNPNRNPSAKSPDDEFHRDQLRSLQALDRGVADIVQKVSDIGQSNNTVFIVLSDNGYMWGEHGLSGKGVGYEEALRVPFSMFGAGIPSGIDERMVYADLDLGPTIIDLAGLSAPASDGASLQPVLAGENPPWRESMLFENWGYGSNGPYATWAALRTDGWKYIRQANGEEELYDLLFDPFEEESLHDDVAFNDVKTVLAAQLDAEKGLAGKPTGPRGSVGVPFFHQLRGWGGSGNYRWYLHDGPLPDGLSLDSRSGVISGSPTSVGVSTLLVRIEDGTFGTHSGLPRQHVYKVRIKIQ